MFIFSPFFLISVQHFLKRGGFFFICKCFKVAATAASYDLRRAKRHYRFVTEYTSKILCLLIYFFHRVWTKRKPKKKVIIFN